MLRALSTGGPPCLRLCMVPAAHRVPVPGAPRPPPRVAATRAPGGVPGLRRLPAAARALRQPPRTRKLHVSQHSVRAAAAGGGSGLAAGGGEGLSLPGSSEFLTLKSTGVKLHCRVAGPADGELLLFLHGFPELWYSWRHQLDYFAELGYRCAAVDMRGYNLSDRPAGVASYGMGVLCQDVEDMVYALGRERGTVVGHDWGGGIAWTTAMRHSDVVERLVVLNCAHPAVFSEALETGNMGQILKSWYIGAFQLPLLPEAIMCAGGGAILKSFIRGDLVDKASFSDQDIQVYTAAICIPGAATATISYYRALLPAALRRLRGEGAVWESVEGSAIQMPTLVVWGKQDRYFDPAVMTRECLEGRVADLTFAEIEGASHWVQTEAPGPVNGHIERFLASRPVGGGGK